MNCPKVSILAAIAAVAIFSANKVSAVPGPVNISATATFEVDTLVGNPATSETFAAKKETLNNAKILTLLQTAVENNLPDAGDATWFTDRGTQLVYDPDAINTNASISYGNSIYGIFWVTNKLEQRGFQLDGLDGSGYYWSLVELDFAPLALGFSLDGELNQNSASSGKYVASPYQYSAKMIGNATFYIHDNPYDYDYPLNFDSAALDLPPSQNYSVVLNGPITYSYSYSFDSKTGLYKARVSFSIKGSGDGIWNDGSFDDIQPVFSGSVTSKDSGEETAGLPAPF
jgi:hypothetical protein